MGSKQSNEDMKDKKIALFMLPLLTQGAGAEKYFVNLARHLSDRGYKIDIITMDESFFKIFARLLHVFTHGNFFRKIDISGRETETAIKHRLGNSNWIKSSFKKLASYLNNYDIIYSKNEIVDLMLLKLIGYKNLPPVIVGVHTPIHYQITKSFNSKFHNLIYSGPIYHWLLNGAQLVHVSNKFTQNFLYKRFKIKSELFYYPFPMDEMIKEKRKSKSTFSFLKGITNIAFVGRLGEQKGIDILISIINKLATKKEITGKINLNIFGSGEEKYDLEMKKISKKFNWVKYFGHMEHKYILSILSKQNLLISPSRWEVSPFNILEAQAMGLPVIAFNIPGPNDIIEEGKSGFLVNNEDEFIEKLIELVEKKYCFSKKIIQSRIKSKFDPKIIYKSLLKMFKENVGHEKT